MSRKCLLNVRITCPGRGRREFCWLAAPSNRIPSPRLPSWSAGTAPPARRSSIWASFTGQSGLPTLLTHFLAHRNAQRVKCLNAHCRTYFLLISQVLVVVEVGCVYWQLRPQSYWRSGCLVEDDDTFILIGGWQGFHLPEGDHLSVTRYDMDGFVEHLPQLRQERDGSGCSYFYSGYGKVIII